MADLGNIHQAIKNTPSYRAWGEDVWESHTTDISTDGNFSFQFEYNPVSHLITGDKVGLVATRSHGADGNDDGGGNGILFMPKGILSFSYNYDEYRECGDHDRYSVSFYVPSDKSYNPIDLPQLLKELSALDKTVTYKKVFSLEYKADSNIGRNASKGKKV